MEAHLSYAPNNPAGNNSGNSRNGKTKKTVRSTNGDIELDIPRDRNGSFEPKLVRKGERQLNGQLRQKLSKHPKAVSRSSTSLKTSGPVQTKHRAALMDMCLIKDTKKIQEAKSQHDFTFVIVHGGHEYYNIPSPPMQKQYRFDVEQGADLAVGHHTH